MKTNSAPPPFFSNAGGEDSLEEASPYRIRPESSDCDSASQSLAQAHAPSPSDLSARSSLCATLNAELRQVAISNVKFAAILPRRIFETANWLAAYGIPTLGAFRTTDEIARQYLFGDLRKAENAYPPQLAFLSKLDRHIPPHDQKVSEKTMRFAELDIPEALASYAPPLDSLSLSHLSVSLARTK